MTNSTRNLSDRMAVLEVMIEMLVAESIIRDATDKSLDDYGEVAAMMLDRRHPERDMDALLRVLGERLVKVREHVEIVRQLQAKERVN